MGGGLVGEKAGSTTRKFSKKKSQESKTQSTFLPNTNMVDQMTSQTVHVF